MATSVPTASTESRLFGFITGFGLVVFATGAADLVWRVLAGLTRTYEVSSVGLGVLAVGVVIDAGSSSTRWWHRVRAGALVAAALFSTVVMATSGTRLLVAVPILVGAIVAISATVLRSHSPLVLSGEPVGPIPRSLIVVAAVAAAMWIASVTLPSGPFGHDESVYAVQGRSWVLDLPATSVQIYRSPGWSVLAATVAVFTESLVPIRILAGLTSLTFVGLVWGLGRRLFGNGAGAAAALAVAGTAPFLRRAGEFLADVPSAALMVVVVALLHDTFENGRRGLLVVAAAVAGAAFYVRYGVALTLAAVAISAGWVWRDRLREHIGEITISGVVGLALLIPHFVWAQRTQGSPVAALTSAGSVAGGSYLGEGVVEYLTKPVTSFGILGVALALVAVTSWRSDRTERFLLLAGITSVVAIGLRIHAEPRYVYFPLAMLVLVGVRRLQRVAGDQRTVWFVAITALVVVGSVAAVEQRRLVVGLADSYQVVIDASVRAAAIAGPDCDLVTGSRPQVELYSECPARSIGSGMSDPVDEPDEVVVWFADGKNQDAVSILDGLDLIEVVPSDTPSPGDGELYAAP